MVAQLPPKQDREPNSRVGAYGKQNCALLEENGYNDDHHDISREKNPFGSLIVRIIKGAPAKWVGLMLMECG